jgi:hypothetical protein
VGVKTSALPEHEHLNTSLGGRDGGPTASRAGADHEDIGSLGAMHGLKGDISAETSHPVRVLERAEAPACERTGGTSDQ